MGVFNSLSFVRDEIASISGIDRRPRGGLGTFADVAGRALWLALREKEIFLFAAGQWAAIALAYLLWVQMLDWIPESVWRSAAESDDGSIADWVLIGWSFVCVGVAAVPIGILTGCMGATHLLHRQGEPSSIARCLLIVLPRSWPLWSFHWIDGWVTVNQILERLPKKNRGSSAAARAISESLYYAWKLGVAGVLPSIVSGHGLIDSGRNSVAFVRKNFVEVARLRAGYSALCWIVGVTAYVGAIFWLAEVGVVPAGEEVYGHIYAIYLWAALPILAAAALVVLLLRPIYVLALCELYALHLERQGGHVEIPPQPGAPVSAMVSFAALCLVLVAVYLYRDELGITAALAVPYGK